MFGLVATKDWKPRACHCFQLNSKRNNKTQILNTSGTFSFLLNFLLKARHPPHFLMDPPRRQHAIRNTVLHIAFTRPTNQPETSASFLSTTSYFPQMHNTA